jgi:hypothetical protein
LVGVHIELLEVFHFFLYVDVAGLDPVDQVVVLQQFLVFSQFEEAVGRFVLLRVAVEA